MYKYQNYKIDLQLLKHNCTSVQVR